MKDLDIAISLLKNTIDGKHHCYSENKQNKDYDILNKTTNTKYKLVIKHYKQRSTRAWKSIIKKSINSHSIKDKPPFTIVKRKIIQGKFLYLYINNLNKKTYIHYKIK